MKNHIAHRFSPVTDTAEISRILELEPNHSLSFKCKPCKHSTAGIYEGGQKEVRTCPTCHATLIFCPACRRCTSTRDRFKVLICDHCQANFVTDTTRRHLEAQESKSAEIILSGIRATGRMHLGNFFGAIDQFVQFQNGQNFCMFFIADWHTLTTFTDDATEVGLNTLAIAADYLAAGLDPEKSLIYTQSSVPEIAELSLLLSMFQPLGQLEGIPTLKEKLRIKPNEGETEKDAETRVRRAMNLGLLTYPVLMAADILGPQATLIPVGADQKPNVELAIDLARRVNELLGPTLTSPRESINPVVPSLTGGKMGKSQVDSSVVLTDSREEIERKYKRFGVTDPEKVMRGAKGHVENCVSVYPMYKALDGPKKYTLQDDIRKGCEETGELGCADCKHRLAGLLDERIGEFRERRQKLESQKEFVQDVLHFGGLKAREIIRPTLQTLRHKMGILVL